ncbi:MAG: dihydroxy-acid dehydratase [Alphaproteobacteria bacterium]|nr:dihydroxy-acid dehydratase [Alphaproteobacteria bacterium]
MTKTRKTPADLRSANWLAGESMRAFSHRGRLRQLGFSPDDFDGRPVIGILNTWSDLNTCHGHFPERVQQIKRGVYQAGGFPVEMPAITLGEIMMKPTTMLYRNLLAMEAEELIRSYPVDGAVLMGGCDKTTPSLIMGATSAGLPAIYLPAGPMLRGFWNGETLGSGTDHWKYYAEYRAGNIESGVVDEVLAGASRSAGTCMTMGTAATMMSLAETLGMTLPGASSIPAADSNHGVMAAATGRRIVEMVWEDLVPADILTQAAFDNAITVDMAIGGSTNAIIHLVAMAGRAGVDVPLSRFDEISRRTPWLANTRPSGAYLMEDFYYAGGLRALMRQLDDLLDGSAPTVAGTPIGESWTDAVLHNDDVIRTRDNPLGPDGGTVVLTGSLAPDGAVIKQTAADPSLLRHTGPAVVFADRADLDARIDDPDLDVTADSVLVLQNAGPVGAPGMPEWGQLPIPKKLLEAGVRDMVRISDARMSGTSYGTCVLHVAPEAHVGGPLALVQDGDMVTLDVAERKLDLEVDAAELEARRSAWAPRKQIPERGYVSMYAAHVTQANRGCDFDFLHAGAPIPEPEIF